MKNKDFENYRKWTQKYNFDQLPIIERETASGKQSDANYLTHDLLDDPDDEFWQNWSKRHSR